MILTGKITGALIDFATGKPKLELSVNEINAFKQLVNELKEKEKLSVEIKQYREKRSLNANNYAWKLITEIANVLRASKEDIYLLMLKRYGQSEIISVSLIYRLTTMLSILRKQAKAHLTENCSSITEYSRGRANLILVKWRSSLME